MAAAAAAAERPIRSWLVIPKRLPAAAESLSPVLVAAAWVVIVARALLRTFEADAIASWLGSLSIILQTSPSRVAASVVVKVSSYRTGMGEIGRIPSTSWHSEFMAQPVTARESLVDFPQRHSRSVARQFKASAAVARQSRRQELTPETRSGSVVPTGP